MKTLATSTTDRARTRGFTLIELLVVIAIIGILASIVLASLQSAQVKGADSKVYSEMKQIPTETQNYLDSGNVDFGASVVNCTTAGTVFTSTRMTSILSNIAASASAVPNLSCATDSTGSKWAVSVTLRSGPSFCTDNSTGVFSSGKTAATSGVNQGTCQ